MPTQKRVSESISIPSNIKYIRRVSSKIVNLLIERKVDKSLIFDIRLSVEEAILNAIGHGNKNNEDLAVDLSFTIDDKKIEIAVEDRGEGFDFTLLPDPTTDENILRSHGRGVFLIHKLMDKVEYNKKGNKVKLIKYLNI